jgi:Glycosyl transferases group 1
MTLHVVSLPHTSTTAEFSWCAYTTKVRRFATMMHRLDYPVVLYAGPENDAEVTLHFDCTTFPVRNDPDTIPPFDGTSPLFAEFNGAVIRELRNQLEVGDVICVIGGLAQQAIGRAFPTHQVVEFGVGYGGTFADFRVFESYAWMHTVYGAQAGDPHTADGRFYDAVIPNYFDLADFPMGGGGGYYLYLGRLIDRKGWRIAQEVCEDRSLPLVVAGAGEFSGYGEYVGVVGPAQRADLLGHAIATFTPTIYVEPFCGVHVESMLCGTPVITTDWGVFPETVGEAHGRRCRSFAEFAQATDAVIDLDRHRIRADAVSRFSTEVVSRRYQRYLGHLATLCEDGWYTGRSDHGRTMDAKGGASPGGFPQEGRGGGHVDGRVRPEGEVDTEGQHQDQAPGGLGSDFLQVPGQAEVDEVQGSP